MIVYPAIDLRGGKVVRLVEGQAEKQTTYSDDPIATAQKWIDGGTEWLHIVNLDGAFDDENDNLQVVEAITKLGAKVQFGGGLRSLTQMRAAINIGVTRVIIGTAAVQTPDIVNQAIDAFGAEAVCVGMDARDGIIMTHGWRESSGIPVIDFGKDMQARGAIHALFTDVEKDGKMMGVNAEATVRLARETGLNVIASGGVTNANGVMKLARSGTVAGVIIGTALYQGQITVAEALAAAKVKPDAR
jgi:phosphoribosylformimino-5-aminoimidazole carboxamide ribotide isomerase